MDGSNIAAAELRAFVERIERLRAEQADLKEAEKEVFSELAGRGYMKRPVRRILILRAADPAKIAEEDAVTELYKSALGML